MADAEGLPAVGSPDVPGAGGVVPPATELLAPAGSVDVEPLPPQPAAASAIEAARTGTAPNRRNPPERGARARGPGTEERRTDGVVVRG
ncbi:hypothetical protein [Streptomyces sp. NBC_00102]|uniref:hypothetical protein n=1 Tax=Streptomyces sp. NBC_00102 TaxID=2975652 RepID=UPI0022594048|nr:hypothetical protein [Streptomyces sp. NBC_00102]MCX5401239.1 hypothetical protein [Streptomyces sp. NBC_00102]